MQPLSESIFSDLAREPSAQQWQMLTKLDSSTITIEEFLQHWRLNKTQLAKLLRCDRGTLRRHSFRLTPQQQQRLALVHRLWSRV
jgi:DNA-binding protein Fis